MDTFGSAKYLCSAAMSPPSCIDEIEEMTSNESPSGAEVISV